MTSGGLGQFRPEGTSYIGLEMVEETWNWIKERARAIRCIEMTEPENGTTSAAIE
ncbi:hypothetical protein DPEC_G00340340 [Dallia pectoralis]|uniref:Uncharacterized protein n=1 Tax=Dallia pectoralis TaxID=75939 RepID=A0ACC2F547_DALPE|nr:hypothetical protein DPEC_G00340340 [Dallia pectoralis]